MSNIPQYKRTEEFSASDFKKGINIVNDNIVLEMDAIASSALRHEQQVLTTKLKNDEFEFKKLAYNQIETAFQRSQNNPEQLQNDINQIGKSLLSTVPFALKDQTDQWLFSTTQGYISKAKSNELRLETDRLKANTLSELNTIEGILNVTADDILSSDVALNTQARDTLFNKTAQAIELLNGTLSDGTPIFSEVDKFNYMNRLKENTISTGVMRQFDKLDSLEKKKEFLDLFENNQLGIPFTNILTGQPEEIKAAEAVGFNGYDRSVKSMRSAIDSISKQEEKGEWINYVGSVLEGNAQADPSNPLYAKGANEVYGIITKDLKTLPPLARANGMLGFMNKTQVVPTQLVNELKTWINSDDIKDFETGVNLIMAAKEEYPQLLDNLSQKDFGVALLAADKMAAGVNKEKAIMAAKATYSPIDFGITKQRSQDFDKLVKDKGVDFENYTRDALVFFFKDDFRLLTRDAPEASLRYKEIMRTQYELSGDWDTAKKTADAFITRAYKPSILNGGFITYLPPENFYSIPLVDDEWMVDDMKEQARLYIEANSLRLDPEKVFVYADPQSQREYTLNGKPTWILMSYNDAGMPVPLATMGNQPVRWAPDQARQIAIEEEKSRLKYAARLDLENPINVLRAAVGEFGIKPAVEVTKNIIKKGKGKIPENLPQFTGTLSPTGTLPGQFDPSKMDIKGSLKRFLDIQAPVYVGKQLRKGTEKVTEFIAVPFREKLKERRK